MAHDEVRFRPVADLTPTPEQQREVQRLVEEYGIPEERARVLVLERQFDVPPSLDDEDSPASGKSRAGTLHNVQNGLV